MESGANGFHHFLLTAGADRVLPKNPHLLSSPSVPVPLPLFWEVFLKLLFFHGKRPTFCCCIPAKRKIFTPANLREDIQFKRKTIDLLFVFFCFDLWFFCHCVLGLFYPLGSLTSTKVQCMKYRCSFPPQCCLL